MQTYEMVLKTHRHVRRGKQAAVLYFINNQVEEVAVDFRIARHNRQFGMYLAEHQDGFAGCTALGDHGQQVEGDIRVAAQTEAVNLPRSLGNQLRHQVQAIGIDVARRMAVVAADIVLLGRFATQQAAGLQEELLDADIRRQAVTAQVCQVIELFVVGKHPLDKRLEKTALQTITQRRAAQAQRRVDRQPALGQLLDPRVQRIDEVVRLAQAQGQTHVDVCRQTGQHLVHSVLDGTVVRHPHLLPSLFRLTEIESSRWVFDSFLFTYPAF
ncbi:hypothetical protein D9M71_331720 [compost metagenome]